MKGYSEFGWYKGEGQNSVIEDGAFINLGFRPRFLLVKRWNGAEGWSIMDTKRSPNNPITRRTVPDTDAAENTTATTHDFDIMANGFKIRNADGWHNADDINYVYAAFAEHPFKLARAR